MEIIEEHPHSRLIRNRFPYDIWEYHDVVDHLMVVPKRHVRSMSELTDTELAEIAKLLAKFEAKDYNVYARSIDSKHRTVVAHQHTHLIKLDDKSPKLAVFISKPYFLLKR
jgi:diadenosine tetraphosphate (Ap4A) HIT family hydrolase